MHPASAASSELLELCKPTTLKAHAFKAWQELIIRSVSPPHTSPSADTPGQMDVCLSEPEEARQRAFGVDVFLFNEGRLWGASSS